MSDSSEEEPDHKRIYAEIIKKLEKDRLQKKKVHKEKRSVSAKGGSGGVDSDTLRDNRAKLKSLQSRISEPRAGPSHESDDDESSEESEAEKKDKQKDLVMTNNHKQQIQKNQDTLVENMMPDDIFNDLISNKIMTTADINRIKTKETREGMNEELLAILVRRSDRAYYVFATALKKTLQAHLSELLEEPAPKPKSRKRKRKRETGNLHMTLDCEDVTPARRNPLCSCQEVEEQMLAMAKNAYRNVRRRDDTPSSFEQFKKELAATNAIIKDSMEIMHTLKVLCNHDRSIDNISYGSIRFTIHCRTLFGLRDLWDMYTSGRLLTLLQQGFITKEFKKKCRVKEITLRVRIANEEYRQCHRELETLTKHDSRRKQLKRSQQNHFVRDHNPRHNNSENFLSKSPVSPYLESTEPRRVFKEIHRNASLTHCAKVIKSPIIAECVKQPVPWDYYHLRIRSQHHITDR